MINSTVLQNAFYRSQRQRYEMILPNIHLQTGFEMDLFCLRKSRYVEEVEIKVSKSDYKADFKKTVHVKCLESESNPALPWQQHTDLLKHQALTEGRIVSNYFCFLVPADLADDIELPPYAGLYVYTPSRGFPRVACRVSPTLLHKSKVSTDLLYRHTRALSYRYWGNVLKEDMATTGVTQ